MEKQQLKELRRVAGELFSNTDVFLAYAHGSRIEGRALPGSDLDIGYYLQRDSGRDELPLAEEMRLAAKLSTKTGHEVDLRCLQHAPLELRGRALIRGKLVYCSDDLARADFESFVLRFYHDHKELYERMHEERLSKFAGESP